MDFIDRSIGKSGDNRTKVSGNLNSVSFSGDSTLAQAYNIKIGDHFKDRFLIQDIKQGGMAVVYICYDQLMDKNVALKFLHPKLFTTSTLDLVDLISIRTFLKFPDDYEIDQQEMQLLNSLKRFMSEATNWIRLGKQHNIVQAYQVDTIDGMIPYLILEYIKGPPGFGPELLSWISKGALDLSASIDIAIQVCEGMTLASKKFREMGKSFVHRDLTPRNILITEKKNVKITDLGLARVGEFIDMDFETKDQMDRAGFSRTGTICGTPPYMSPEQCLGKPDIDERSDIYSFGCVLYEMLTSKLVFNSRNMDEFVNDHLHTIPRSPNINANVDRIVLKCLEKDPEKRFENFQDLRASLESLEYKTGQKYRNNFSSQKRDDATEVVDLINLGMSIYAANFADGIVVNDQKDPLLIKEIVDCFRRAVELDPGSAEAHYCLGQAYFTQGAPEPSAECIKFVIDQYEKAVTIDPQLFVCWRALGEIYLNRGKTEQAIHAFSQTDRFDNLGEALEKAGRLQDAWIAYSKFTSEDSIWYQKASRYPWYGIEATADHHRFDIEDAMAHIKSLTVKIAEVDKEFSDRDTGRTISGNNEESNHVDGNTLENVSNELGAWINKGISFNEQGQYEEAILCLNKALLLDPVNADALHNKGISLSNLTRHEEALVCFEKALDLDPENPVSLSFKGYTLNCLNRSEEAFFSLDKALDLDPDFSIAWNIKGEVLEGLSRFEEAIFCFDMALKIEPNDQRALVIKGDCLESLERLDEAILCYDRVLEIDSQNTSAWYGKGYVLNNQGKFEQANHCFSKLLVLCPDFSDGWFQKGVSLYSQRRFEEALLCYDRALQIDPVDVYVWYNKALTEDNLNQRLKAGYSFHKFLELSSEENTEQIDHARKRLRDLERE